MDGELGHIFSLHIILWIRPVHIAHICSSWISLHIILWIRPVHIAHFSAQFAQPGAPATCSCTLHIIFSSHCIALDIVHCSFQLSEKLKLRVSHPLHPVRFAKLVILIRADNCIWLEKSIKGGGGFHFQIFRVSKLMNLESKGVFEKN